MSQELKDLFNAATLPSPVREDEFLHDSGSESGRVDGEKENVEDFSSVVRQTRRSIQRGFDNLIQAVENVNDFKVMFQHSRISHVINFDLRCNDINFWVCLIGALSEPFLTPQVLIKIYEFIEIFGQ